jgi:hypothetical protein
MALRALQHHLNALHVMGRMVRLGLPRPTALGLARWWERMVHPLLYPSMRTFVPVPVPARPRRYPRRWDE